MRTLQVGIVAIISIIALVVIILWGFSTVTSLRTTLPATAESPGEPAPKIVQTQKEMIIFTNPLVDQSGLSVEEVLERKDELLGQEVIVKGEVRRKEGEWGFLLEEAGAENDQILIVTHPSVTSEEVSSFVPSTQKYARVKGQLKEMIFTDQERIESTPTSGDSPFTPPRRLVIIAQEIQPIAL